MSTESKKSSKVIPFIVLSSILHIVTMVCCVYLACELSYLKTVKPLLHNSETSGIELESKSSSHDDNWIIRSRRDATYSSLAGVSSLCGWTTRILWNTTGTFYDIQSPNNSHQNYSNNLLCEWNFVLGFPQPAGYSGSHVLRGVMLKISFRSPIDVEYHEECRNDVIQIRGGGNRGPLLASYCGLNQSVADVEFHGPLHVSFKTNSQISAKGFQARISVLSNMNELLGEPGVMRRNDERAGLQGQDGQSGAPRSGGSSGFDAQPGQRGEPGTPGRNGQHETPGRHGGQGQEGGSGQSGSNGQPGRQKRSGSPSRDGGHGQHGAPGLPGFDGEAGTPGSQGRDGQNGSSGERGQPGAAGSAGFDGQAGAPGSPGRDGQNGRAGERGQDGSVGGGDHRYQVSRDVTFTRWGRISCPEQGLAFYDGYAVGFAGSGGSLRCAPFPLELKFGDQSADNAPTLTAARFNLQGVTNALTTDVHNKVIRCVLCHSYRTEIFTVIGWQNCNSNHDWQTLYSGFLMTVSTSSNSASSEPICVDKSPEISEGYGTDLRAPELTYINSGTGLWIEGKIMPCAVCIKTI